MFFRKQRSEGIEGLDRIRESLRQQQQERRDRGEVDDLLVTDPSELDEGVAVIKPVRESASPDDDEEETPLSDSSAETAETRADASVPAEIETIEPTPFVEAPEPVAEASYEAQSATVSATTVEPEPVVEPVAQVSTPPPPPAVREPEPPAVQPSAPASAPPLEATLERMRRPDTFRPTGNGESLIARNATWDGQLYAEGDVRVEGSLQGSIEANGTLFIAQDARVNAKVRARNIVIAGEFDGEITCEEKLEVLPSGSIAGEVNASMLVIHEGAFVDSRFAMNVAHGAARNARK